jgi:unsaturated rhamnogalacturonyl hydrolase
VYDFTVWFWGDAIAIDGLLDAAELLDDRTIQEFCLGFFRRWASRPLGWADHLTPGGSLLRLSEATKESALLDAARRLASWLLHEVPKAPFNGAHLYRPDLPAYRHTVWVDTIYHEPPFFARLAQVTGNNEYYQAAVDIWNTHVQALRSAQSPFLAHAYDTGAQLQRGSGWGRGNGWALYGMVDTLELLPPNFPGRPEALDTFLTLSQAVARSQDRSGFWRTLIADKESYLESSTAAFFGAVFTKAVRLGLLPRNYLDVADRAWEAVLSRLDGRGGFYGVSACTYASVSPGDDAAMYRTLPTEINVWGQGSILRFAAERIRLEVSIG